MKMSRRGKRRLILVASIAVVGATAIAGVKMMRTAQQARLVAQARDDGMRAFHQGDLETALRELSYYIQQEKQDIEVLFTFADARSQLPLVNGKHLREAAAYYDTALSILDRAAGHPDRDALRDTAMHRLLDLHAALGRRFELLQIADRLLKIDADDPAALTARARALYSDRRFDEAAVAVGRLIELEPEVLSWRRLRLDLLRQQHAPDDELLAVCDEWMSGSKSDGRFHLLKAGVLLNAGRVDAALETAHQAASAGVTSLEVLQQLVALLDLMGAGDRAELLIDQSKSRFPHDQWVREAAARRAWQAGRLEQALAEIDQAERVVGDIGAALLRLRALAHLSASGLDVAAPTLDALASTDNSATDESDRVWAEALRAAFDERNSDITHRLKVTQRAAALNPEDAELALLIAQAYAAVGENALALDAYQQAYQLDPAWVAAGFGYARALIAAGRFEEALVVTRLVGARTPSDRAEPFILLAEACVGLQRMGQSPTITLTATGQTINMLSMVEQLHQQLPGHPRIASLLAESYGRAGRIDDAQAMLDRAIDTGPDDAEFYVELAGASRRMNLGMTAALLRRAREVAGRTMAVAFAEAQMHADEGDPEAGLRVIERARKSATAQELAIDENQQRYLSYLLRVNDERAHAELARFVDSHATSPRAQTFALAQTITWSDAELLDRAIDNLESLLGGDAQQVRLARASRMLRDHGDDEQHLAEAIVLITSVLEQSPDSLAALTLLARAYTSGASPAPQQAAEYLQRALDIYPAQASLYPKLISLLQQVGEFETASRYLNRFSDLTERTSDLRRAELQLLHTQGEFESALVRAASIASETELPTDELALAVAYQRAGRFEDAEVIYARMRDMRADDPFVLAQSADFYALTGRFAIAEQLIGDLSAQGDEVSSSLIVGGFYQRHGRLDQATPWFETAVDADRSHVGAWDALARHYMSDRRYGNARDAAMQGLTLAPDHRGLQTTLAVAGLQLDDDSAALAIEQLRRHDEPNLALIETLSLLSRVPRIDGVTTPTETNLDDAGELVKSHPRYLPAWLLAISLHVETDRIATAADLSRQASSRFRTNPESAQWAARLLVQAGQLEGALAEAEEWRRRTMTTPLPALVMEASILIELDRAHAAVERLEPYALQFVEQRDVHPDRLAIWLRSLVRIGDVDRAARVSKELLSEPKWRHLWLSFSEEVDATVARGVLEFLAPAMDSNPEERLYLASAWTALGERSNERKYLQTAEQLALSVHEPSQFLLMAQLVLGRIAEANADWHEAERLYGVAIQLSPSNAIALNNLAFVIAQDESRGHDALPLIERALQLQPNEPALLDTYALVLRRLDRLDDALSVVSDAWRLQPSDPGIGLHLAETLLELERPDEAWEAVQAVQRAMNLVAQPDADDTRRLQRLRQQLALTHSAGVSH